MIQCADLNRRLNEFDVVFLKLQVVDDLRKKWTHAGRESRTAKTRMKFFGDGCPANYLAPFKHERFQSRFREIVSSDEAVVSGADD